MKAEDARRIRDWIALNKMDIREEEDSFNVENWKKRKTEFESYVKERVPSPVGDIFFDSKEYLWTTNTFLRNLRKTQREYLVRHYKSHNRKLYCFALLSDVVIYAMFFLPFLFGAYLGVAASIPLWVKFLCVVGSFALFQFSGRRLARKLDWFLYEATEMIEENDNFDLRWEYAKNGFIGLRYSAQWAKSRYSADFHAGFGPYGRDVDGPYEEDSATYDWKQVKENKFIIVDKETGKEAPLLPGVSPYVKESFFG